MALQERCGDSLTFPHALKSALSLRTCPQGTFLTTSFEPKSRARLQSRTRLRLILSVETQRLVEAQTVVEVRHSQIADQVWAVGGVRCGCQIGDALAKPLFGFVSPRRQVSRCSPRLTSGRISGERFHHTDGSRTSVAKLTRQIEALSGDRSLGLFSIVSHETR